MCASTSAGMPSRPMVWSSSSCTGPVRTRLRGQAQRAERRRGRRPSSAAGDAAVERGRELRRPGGGAEGVDHLDDRLRLGVDQVERLAVEAGQVGEVVHRLGDVVDRHHVGVAEVDADQRQPGRQRCRAAA